MEVELLSFYGTDRDIANSAWTSSTEQIKKETRTNQEVARVVNYLIDNGHGSPLEQVVYKFHLRVPIFVSRQFLRHRIQSPNEMSGRYRTMLNEYYKLPSDVINILEANKMGDEIEAYNNLMTKQYNFYKGVLDKLDKKADSYKRVREVMRGVLGTGYYTEIVTSINLRSLANFFKQRLDKHAQKEMQEVAKMMLYEVIKSNSCPVAIARLEKKGWIVFPMLARRFESKESN